MPIIKLQISYFIIEITYSIPNILNIVKHFSIFVIIYKYNITYTALTIHISKCSFRFWASLVMLVSSNQHLAHSHFLLQHKTGKITAIEHNRTLRSRATITRRKGTNNLLCTKTWSVWAGQSAIALGLGDTWSYTRPVCVSNAINYLARSARNARTI